MIYIFPDTNILIYLFQDYHKTGNHFFKLKFLLEKKVVQLVIVDKIKIEWLRLKELRKVDQLVKLKRALLILENSNFKPGIDLSSKELLSEMIDDFYKMLTSTIESNSVEFKVGNEFDNEVIKRATSKTPPMDQSDCVIDTILLLAFKKQLNENTEDDFFLISNDLKAFKTFDDESKDYESSLYNEFLEFENYKYFADYQNALNYIVQMCIRKDLIKQKEIDSFVEENSFITSLRQKAKPELELKTTEYSPPKDMVIPDSVRESSYSELIQEVEIIKKKRLPSKQHILRLLEIIKVEPKTKGYFFENLDNPFWFETLKINDFLNVDAIPKPKEVENGWDVPFWNEGAYLLQLSEKFKDEENLDLVNEVFQIINDSAKAQIDNYRVVYQFYQIVNNTPNDNVTKTVLKSLIKLFDCRFARDLLSISLVDNLIPKFVNKKSKSEDLEKGELLLELTLSIEKEEGANDYHTKVVQHSLLNNLLRKTDPSLISEHYFDFVTKIIEENIGKLIYKEDATLELNLSVLTDFRIKAQMDGTRVSFKITKGDELIKEITIQRFDLIPPNEVEAQLASIISNESSLEDKQLIGSFIYQLRNGIYFGSIFGYTIGDLNERTVYGDEVVKNLTIILREILLASVKNNLEKLRNKIIEYLDNPSENSPIFKQIAVFLLAHSFNDNINLFVKTITNDPTKDFNPFHFDAVEGEFYNLLKENGNQIDDELRNNIFEIIRKGPVYDKDVNYWKLRWYSALRNFNEFNDEYLELARYIGIKEEDDNPFERHKGVRITSGDRSPITKEDLAQKNDGQVAKYLNDYVPSDKWDGHNKEGLSQVLQKVVEEEPNRFLKQEFVKKLEPIYQYHILRGIEIALPKDDLIDLNSLFQILELLIEGENLNDDYYRKENIIGMVASVLREVLTHKPKQCDTDRLYQIIIKCLGIVQNEEEKDGIQSDYLTYTINTNYGKCLQALYHFGTANYNDENSYSLWSEQIKPIIEESFEINKVASYALFGRFLNLISWYDESFSVNSIKKLVGINQEAPFLNGHMYGQICNKQAVFNELSPLLKKSIKNSHSNAMTDQVLHSRLVNYQFWGFDRKEGGVNEYFIDNAPGESVRQYFNFLGRQEDYFEHLKQEERNEFIAVLVYIYKKGLEKFNSDQDYESSVYILTLLNYYDSLKSDVFKLLNSGKFKVKMFHYLEDLFQNIQRFLNGSDPNYKDIAELINLVDIQLHYLGEETEKLIYDAVEVLYQNGQSDSMNQFCDSMAKKDFLILVPLYNKYN